MSRIIDVKQTFDRDKHLDEGVFLAVCGLNMCREKSFITGVVRLEMAVHKIQSTISHIYRKKMSYPDSGCDSEEHS